MIYSTSYCPHCKKPINYQTNPVKKLGSPFNTCPLCGEIYLDSKTEEWITKSPFKRHMYFLQYGTWARAFILPLLFFSIFNLYDAFSMGLWLFCFIVYMIIAYFFHKSRAFEDINLSLQRTSDLNYLELLKKAGYTIYPIDPNDTDKKDEP